MHQSALSSYLWRAAMCSFKHCVKKRVDMIRTYSEIVKKKPKSSII